MRLAILDDYQGVALHSADWSAVQRLVNISVFRSHLGDVDAAATALREFEILVAMRERTPFPRQLLERLPSLRLLVTTGMRNLAIDTVAARELGIDVCGTPMLGYPAAEHTWALILALVKQVSAEDRVMHQGGWQCGLSTGLQNNMLGIVGLGKLGAQVAKVGLAFGMKVQAWSANLTSERCAECGVVRVELNELLSTSDIVTVHLVLSDRTRGLIGTDELAQMKSTAYLVNTARGPIVQETALIAALQNGTIAGAGLDVYDNEPLPPDHPLRSLGNTVLTGHTGYVMRENYARGYSGTVENVVAWLNDSPVRLLN
ncbi:MAG: D-2-hydroxyacid dehydrogenase family protein [Pseudomonadota bacterium]|nr:D-2-hydroxyacid dehydrogenase family protein [Pseudomonadota bacterium]MEE3287365.1 D-2-hydroxyacid dehydrogenase family protein [Pseudomonadota bacterium]